MSASVNPRKKPRDTSKHPKEQKKAGPPASKTFYAFFQNAVGSSIIVRTKDGIQIAGRVVSIDPDLNLCLENISCVNEKAKSTDFLKKMTSLVFLRASSVESMEFEDNVVNGAALTKFCRER